MIVSSYDYIFAVILSLSLFITTCYALSLGLIASILIVLPIILLVYVTGGFPLCPGTI